VGQDAKPAATDAPHFGQYMNCLLNRKLIYLITNEETQAEGMAVP
jgi:hypothetical protein